MTTATPAATPAKKAAKKAASKPPAPPFDFTAIQVTDGAAPTRTGSREALPNPFVDHLKKSADAKTNRPGGGWIGQGKQVTVPAVQADQVVNLIRYAANRLGLGVTVSDHNDASYKRPNGMVQINFAAKNRKQKRTTAPTNNGV